MSVQSSEQISAQAAASGFDALEIGRLTWIGLIVAGIGWALVIGETATADILSGKGTRAVPATFHADLIEIGKCIIASGFGLAFLGALQTGFGTLNRFFAAVLIRSSQRSSQRPASVVVESTAATPRDKRPYRTLPDGSVEVETILGTRRFKTMVEAREFI